MDDYLRAAVAPTSITVPNAAGAHSMSGSPLRTPITQHAIDATPISASSGIAARRTAVHARSFNRQYARPARSTKFMGPGWQNARLPGGERRAHKQSGT
jgi:hypothetical protein